VHFYWIGAIPAMVFLGIVMMPFYYNSKVRSVPEYLRLRFNDATHVLNSLSFAVATVLIAGVNLFAMALVIRLLLGWPIPISIVLAAVIVLVYISPWAACPRRSTTRSCSSSSSWPAWSRSRSWG